MTKKLVIFGFYGRFRELLPTVLRFRGDLQGPWHSVYVWEAWPKTHRFCVLGMFSWAIAHNFGVPWRFTRNMTVYIFLRGMIKNLSFLRLWPFSGAIAHSFGVPVWFTRPMTLSIVLRGMTKNSSFYVLGPFLWAIVHCFGVLGWFTRNMTFRAF
jgi:hypothetical protein